MENPGGFCRRRLTGWSDGELPCAQGVEQGQLFRDGPGGEVAAQGLFALQNFGRIKGHGCSCAPICWQYYIRPRAHVASKHREDGSPSLRFLIKAGLSLCSLHSLAAIPFRVFGVFRGLSIRDLCKRSVAAFGRKPNPSISKGLRRSAETPLRRMTGFAEVSIRVYPVHPWLN